MIYYEQKVLNCVHRTGNNFSTMFTYECKSEVSIDTTLNRSYRANYNQKELCRQKELNLIGVKRFATLQQK